MSIFLVLAFDTFSKWAVLISSPSIPCCHHHHHRGEGSQVLVLVFALPGRASELFVLEAITLVSVLKHLMREQGG